MAVSPQTLEKSRDLAEERKLRFPILRDERNAYAAQYNVLNRLPDDLHALYLTFGIDVVASNGEDSLTLPVSGSYVIDGGGVIRFAAADADHTRRPEPEDTVAVLENLG